MDLEFSSRSSRLLKEQQQRRSQAQDKIHKEREERRKARLAQEEIEKQIKERRLEQARLEAEALQKEEEERQKTAGIHFCERLSAVVAPGDGDKVILPPSALETLSQQDAISHGPMLFELTVDGAHGKTHGGVLEFVAEEGTVGLPRKVWRSLGLRGEDVDVKESLSVYVHVKYIRLPKAEYARVIPVTSGLSQISELRVMLEQNLQFHATLSEGDLLEVWHRGKCFETRVAEIKPSPAATIMNTDMELDLDLPDEVKQAHEEKSAADRARTLQGSSPPRPISAASLSPPKGLTRMDIVDNSDASSDESSIDEDEKLARKLAALPDQPEDTDGAITCLVRSRGVRATRRFLADDPLSRLFDWMETVPGWHAAMGDDWKLVVPYPRRVLTLQNDGSRTFTELGLTSKQETFMLENS